MAEYIPINELTGDEIVDMSETTPNEEEISFGPDNRPNNRPDNPYDFILPDIINDRDFPYGKSLANEASRDVIQRRTSDLLNFLKVDHISPKIKIYVDSSEHIYAKHKNSTKWYCRGLVGEPKV